MRLFVIGLDRLEQDYVDVDNEELIIAKDKEQAINIYLADWSEKNKEKYSIRLMIREIDITKPGIIKTGCNADHL